MHSHTPQLLGSCVPGARTCGVRGTTSTWTLRRAGAVVPPGGDQPWGGFCPGFLLVVSHSV